ncbi:MAG: hypothetical protein ACI9ND_000376, partial [Yoonia sp.]
MRETKMGKNMATMRQPALNSWDQDGTGERQSIVTGQNEGIFAVNKQLPGAIVRGLIVI